MRRALPASLALAVITVALAGCGSSGSSAGTDAGTSGATTGGSHGPTPTAPAKAAAKQAAASAAGAEAKAPKGASPTLRQVYRQFPTPVAGPHEGAGAAAIAAGERACAGKTPLEVKERFYGAARPNLEAEQAKMIARLGAYEERAATDPSFVAGQLAADVYAATLPETAQAGYQGCIHALAQGLERRLAPDEK